MLGRLVKELLWDCGGTISLGRCLAVWFAGLFTLVVLVLLALTAFVVASGQMVEGAAFAAAVGAPLTALLTGPVAGTVAAYVGQKWLAGRGSVTSEQLDAGGDV